MNKLQFSKLESVFKIIKMKNEDYYWTLYYHSYIKALMKKLLA